jgi:hypothetical protein
MARTTRVAAARLAFAKVTAALEDAALVAAEGQTFPNLAAARRSCDSMIARLEACLVRLGRLRMRLG